jgi:hypothetical protein
MPVECKRTAFIDTSRKDPRMIFRGRTKILRVLDGVCTKLPKKVGKINTEKAHPKTKKRSDAPDGHCEVFR